METAPRAVKWIVTIISISKIGIYIFGIYSLFSGGFSWAILGFFAGSLIAGGATSVSIEKQSHYADIVATPWIEYALHFIAEIVLLGFLFFFALKNLD